MSSQSSSNFVRIELAPKPGFCVKSTLLTPGILPAPKQPPQSNANLLEPAPDPTPLPKGLKVFINIAWDSNVPPPPEGSEDAIKRAMQGEDIDENNPSGWYVPMIISNGRQDKDKAGNPSLVFDCVCNTSVKSRTLRDPEFKTFIIELALQRIEEQTHLTLSRTIGTPNILSKGKLLPRTVQIPAALAPSLVGKPPPKDASSSGSHSRPLIQEIDSEKNPASPSVVSHGSSEPQKPKASQSTSKAADAMLPGLRGILKKPSGSTNASKPHISATNGVGSSKVDVIHNDVPLDWSWSKEDSGRLRIDVNVPGLVRARFLPLFAYSHANSAILAGGRHQPSSKVLRSTLKPAESFSLFLVAEL
ncbi:hypothetical protein D9613_003812 [Agrocybe pediades]|uniref:PIH1 N-terminal domain-containing protein n=1 Tax=Agrocybe pediades TaxID=84607 RepID=A0A8H4QJE9_9AGAR|nr:hypothetical protein D9613_003812 [Agrocybe pediades]